jgi:hypothetical protein
VTRQSMQGGALTVTVTGLPDGVTASVGALSTTTSLVATATITLTASANAPVVTAAVFGVRGTLAGGLTATAVCRVTVPEPPPGPLFVLSVQSPVNLVRDATVAVAITALRNAGFAASIDLSIDQALPSGVTASFAEDPMTATSTTLTLSATNVATLGQVTVTVRGEAVGSDDNTASLTFTVVAAGSFGYLAPLYELAQPFDAAGLTFNASTGLITGEIIDTTWITPAWLAANADTVQTIKASGGTYTPAQAQAAVDAAATRNDLTVFVVDADVVLPAHEWRGKGVGYASANWTLFVSKPWWDATWTPSGNRPVEVSGVNDETSNLFQVMTSTTAITPLFRPGAGTTNCHKYGYIGAWFRRNPASTSSTQINLTSTARPEGNGDLTSAQLPTGSQFHWCYFDGGDPSWDGTVGLRWTRVGMAIAGVGVCIEHCCFAGIAGGGSFGVEESKALLIDRRAQYLQVRYCVMEAGSITILSGGTDFTDPTWCPADVWIDRVGLVRRQQWNPASSTYNGLGNASKQAFEIKYGKRFTIHGLDILNVWTGGGQVGSGFTIQCTAQDQTASSTTVAETKDIVARNLRIRNCNFPLGMTKPNGSNSNQQDAMGRIDVQNVFGIIGERLKLNNTASAIDAMRLPFGQFGAVPLQRVDLWGPMQLQWMTLVAPKTEPKVQSSLRMIAAEADASRASDCDFTMRNVIFPHAATQTSGVFQEFVLGRTGPQLGAAQAFESMTFGGRGVVNIGNNVMPRGSDSLRRNTYQTLYPEQYATAAHWPSDITGYGFTNATDDPLLGDYTLDAGSPLKGLGDGGRDPGCVMTLIETAVDDILDYVPSFITLTFPTP